MPGAVELFNTLELHKVGHELCIQACDTSGRSDFLIGITLSAI